MMIDASAFLAILLAEENGPDIAQRIAAAKAPYTSPLAVYETAARLMKVRQMAAADAETIIRALLDEAGIRVIHITDSMTTAALRAFEQYGGSRHPAGLNLGDCYAYACAKAYRAPLIYTGADFAQTDLCATPK
ncbi:type II toxin-antitoxin system VapC family toxin (plasmid) [Methylocystis sp. MJC1]|uniref:type II toxin-antitoxin system VapC family toxin n=1 Tax=Methylocystis sp. MJC1 TaxID=2654282 RepID=UPI0013EA101E|nr:type II toxin-antitoxin system VapC family toxin [Methylocystis sp. MJC1]KAF2988931.1 Ribonuclease VapC36 [Methylocystis sp. MJC1]MBU6529374.1 type II toxin-antitoxin system VapC family toxin [Methylocystis sp. MJC1]UZX14113.1 type II toxin-antitoxin system VapC family toxin [Methylocystis sp. MJC1]